MSNNGSSFLQAFQTQMGPDENGNPDDVTFEMTHVPGGKAIAMQDKDIIAADTALTSQANPRAPLSGGAERFFDTPAGKIVMIGAGLWLMMGAINFLRG